MSYRRLWVLVTRLPADSWTQTALRDSAEPQPADLVEEQEERFGPWALVNYQLAQLIDAIRRIEYVEALAGGLEPKPEPPKPTPRPGVSNIRRLRSPQQVAYLKALRAKGA